MALRSLVHPRRVKSRPQWSEPTRRIRECRSAGCHAHGPQQKIVPEMEEPWRLSNVQVPIAKYQTESGRSEGCCGCCSYFALHRLFRGSFLAFHKVRRISGELGFSQYENRNASRPNSQDAIKR